VFLLVPYRSDAVARSVPWATALLIAVNLLLAVCVGFWGEKGIEPLVLHYGRLEPWTWVTSTFVHLGWVHLLGNMIFLWAFGFVVEGLVGGARFLALCAAIAFGAGLIEAVLMVQADAGGSVGASGVVFGLMAVAALWSPRTTLTCFFCILPFIRTALEMPLLRLCWIYFGCNILFAAFSGFSMGTEVLHLLGAGVGCALGWWMLRRRLVDTEGWDWIALREHPMGPRAGTWIAGRGTAARGVPPPPTPRAGPRATAGGRAAVVLLEEARALLGRERPDEALALLARVERETLSDRERLDFRCLEDAARAMGAYGPPAPGAGVRRVPRG